MGSVPAHAWLLPIILLAAVAGGIFMKATKVFPGTGMLNFHLKRNIFLVLGVLNCLILFGCAINIWNWSVDHKDVEFKFFGNRRKGSLHSASAVLAFEGVFTAAFCAALFGTTAPWDGFDEYEKTNKIEKWIVIGLQVFWSVVFGLSWLARIAVMEAASEAEKLPYAIMPEATKHACWACAMTAVYETIFLMWWCAWQTWWSRKTYEQYQCPVCEGNGDCDTCKEGMVYLHP